MLQFGLVARRARGYERVGGGYEYAPRPGLARQLVGAPPDVVVNREFREEPREVPKRILLTFAPCAVSQLKTDHGAPARLTGFEGAFDPAPHFGATVRTQKVNPRGRINEQQRRQPVRRRA